MSTRCFSYFVCHQDFKYWVFGFHFCYCTVSSHKGKQYFYFFKDFIYLFLAGKGGRKRGRETSVCGCLSRAPSWGPDPQPRHVPWLGIELATFGLQASTPSTEPHQPGPHSISYSLLINASFKWFTKQIPQHRGSLSMGLFIWNQVSWLWYRCHICLFIQDVPFMLCN